MNMRTILISFGISLLFAQSALAHLSTDKYTVASTNNVKITLDFRDKFLTKDIKTGVACLSTGNLQVTEAKLSRDGATDSDFVLLNIRKESRSRCATIDLNFEHAGAWNLDITFNNGDSASFDLKVAYAVKISNLGIGKEVAIIYSQEINESPQSIKLCNAFHADFQQVQVLTGDLLEDLNFSLEGHSCIIADGFYVLPESESNLLIVAFASGDILTEEIQ